MEWETVIGLEIHAQLATRSKIFSGSATAYGAPPNAQANLVDLAYPGVLPVLNAEAVRMAVKFGLAINARVARRSMFARKNYFYPDLPKGYQISQYELPIVCGGAVDIVLEDGSIKRIGVTRAHLEEDAGKSLHEGLAGLTGVDLNRAGTPLIEIVSEPHMRSAKEAVAYLKKMHTLVRYLGICDGNMQEGSFRCDANVSVRPRGTEKLGTRAELKNLNSFRFVEKAINYEIARQIELLEGGGKVVQETRLYDSDRGETRSMRSKEEANDYRYFPDPDLLPLEIDQAYIDAVAAHAAGAAGSEGAALHERLRAVGLRRRRADGERGARRLLRGRGARPRRSPQTRGQLRHGRARGAAQSRRRRDRRSRVDPHSLAALLKRVADNTISGKIAKDVLEAMWDEGAAGRRHHRGPRPEADHRRVAPSSAPSTRSWRPIRAQLADYRAGKEKLFGFFVGQVMKATAGKANPARLNELLKKKLSG